MTDIDFSFAWEGASPAGGFWRHLEVTQIRGNEVVSGLYRYEITLFAREAAPEIDPEDLIQTRATLRIATLTAPAYRVVHGIISEAEELGPIHHGMLYRVVLSPPLARAQHRTRCRIFLEKTTRQIIDAVLQGDPQLRPADGGTALPDGGDEASFSPATELYTWRIADPARLDDGAARPYCVQYNESDLDFMARLLEEEGVSYHFEHGEGVCLLVLSDTDGGRARLEPFFPLGPSLAGRELTSMKLGARLRPRKVSLLDYNWKKPALDMGVATQDRQDTADLVAHEYPGRYPDTPDQGRPLAQAKLDRLAVEASYASGEGACRLLGAGSIFALEHPMARYEGEYLVTRLELDAEQQGTLGPASGGPDPLQDVPFRMRFECARRGRGGTIAESRFRPARVISKPRIYGTQTAFVTAEPTAQGTEIHVGGPPGAEIGCVRVKFHWDKDSSRHAKEASSCWVRVNQVFAGIGEGAVFHPRVGVEVIVDFEEGDPDRPIVVGRVYNGQNRPPGGAPTVSTFKTMTSPGGGTHNELRFDDTAGSQQILLHTPKDWNNEVGNDRSEQVGKNSRSTVGVDRNETTGSNRTTIVGSNNTEIVGSNETITVGSNQATVVGSDQAIAVGANQTVAVGANQDVEIGANQSLKVAANQSEDVGGNRKFTVIGDDEQSVTGTQDITVTGAQTTAFQATHELTVSGKQKIDVGGPQITTVSGAQEMTSATSQKLEAPSQEVIAAGKQKLQSTDFEAKAAASAKIDTALLELLASGSIKMEAGELVITSGPVTITGGDITINGGSVKIAGGTVGVSGGMVDVVGGLVKLN
ncbi:type VI secretion system Vgr family protein [Chondromyces apiculatus]|uniref:VgrG protein n=1 Tax=Chondromyces apiculatus DSM 436 TaxID=1192034 RepID=A0A017TFP5_9BACT|nr:type VI secretion system tip protein TssI/VgrG [Chondromyces apiculatus]EYF08098.1 VgrG protein [Chondromyces apiculatus DSM 436]